MKKFLVVISIILVLTVCFCACSSDNGLPEEMSGEEMDQPSTFLDGDPADEEAKRLVSLVDYSAKNAFSSGYYVGYYEETKTVYLVVYSSLSKSTVSEKVKTGMRSSAESFANGIFKDSEIKCDIVLVSGSKYSSKLDIILIAEGSEFIVDYTK